MTEQERVDKLKARMSRWQAYVDRPQSSTVSPPSETDEIPPGIHERRPNRPSSDDPALMLPAPTKRASPGHRGVYRESPMPDPLTALQEARIADLKVAIVREREQADRLAEEVRREQNLHAATLYSHIVEERARHREVPPTQPPIPEILPMTYEDLRRKNLVRLFGLFAVITSILVLTFFLSR